MSIDAIVPPLGGSRNSSSYGRSLPSAAAQLGLEVGLGHAGQDAAVALDARAAGHHVARARAAQPGRRDRDAEQRRQLVREAGMQRRCARDRVVEVAVELADERLEHRPGLGQQMTLRSGAPRGGSISVASRGTALAPAVGVEAWPASPSAVTSTGSVAFSPTLIGTTTRPSASDEPLAAALVQGVVGARCRAARRPARSGRPPRCRPPRRPRR